MPPLTNSNFRYINMKKLSILLLMVLFVASCDSIFDTGDVKKSYDGPTVTAFFPLQLQTRLVNTTANVRVQLIGPQRTTDTTVGFSVDPASTAIAGTHYTLGTTSPVTIPTGQSEATIIINLISGSLTSGEVRLLLNLDGAVDAPASENLKRSTVFIRP